MLLVFLLSLIVIVLSHKKRHECGHDKLDHKVYQHFVNYKNHPYEKRVNKKRNLVETTDYQSIRIKPYYVPSYINNITLTPSQQTYIKSLTSAAINFIESFTSVIPVDGPLFLNKCPTWNVYDSFISPACYYQDYYDDATCGSLVQFPDDHVGESWLTDTDSTSTLYQAAGSGIADADTVIYVTYGDHGIACSGTTLAWALPCTLDQYGRPVSGTINFCSYALSDSYWKYDVLVTLHELTHVFIMHDHLWNYFYNNDLETFVSSDDVIGNDGINYYLTTSKVKQVAQTHFDCDTILGAPLENRNGDADSHWEQKYLMFEYMGPIIFSGMTYVSDFTLALMEDSGHYQIDYDYSEPYTWGLNEGCTFFNLDCVVDDISNFEQYWCEGITDNGCSFDYSSIGYCLNYAGGVIPDNFRWYSDTTFGGADTTDYCAFRDPEAYWNYEDYEEVCWDTRGNALSPTPYPTSIYGIDSRCVDTTSSGGTQSGYCFKHECIEYDTNNKQYNAINIEISGTETIKCYRNQTMVSKNSNSYSLLSTIKCPNIDAICGKSMNPFQCYWGEYNDDLSKCICLPGYIGDDCNTEDTNNFVNEASSPLTTFVPLIDVATVCIYDITGSSWSINGEYTVEDNEFEGEYVFYSSTSAMYIYYVRAYSSWYFGSDTGDLSIYAFCRQIANFGNGFTNIADCDEMYIYDSGVGEFVLQENVIATINNDNCPTPVNTPSPVVENTPSPVNGGNGNDAVKLKSFTLINGLLVSLITFSCFV